jgi:hypothetical protein
MGRDYQNTKTSRQVIAQLREENENLAEENLRVTLQLRAANETIGDQDAQIVALTKESTGQSAEDSRLMDILEESSGVIMPMWEKAGLSSPSYLHVKGSEHRARTWREAINLIQYT